MCRGDTDFGRLIVITDRKLVKGDFTTQIKKVVNLAPNSLILREKDLSGEAYGHLACQIEPICRESGVPFFIHGREDVAKRLGVKRIHLPFGMLTDQKERFEEVSVSCHSVREAVYAAEHGASRIILGTVFETECKKGVTGKGLLFVREVCEACSVPVYAIGGITQEKLPQVLEAGAAGGCMMSGFMRL